MSITAIHFYWLHFEITLYSIWSFHFPQIFKVQTHRPPKQVHVLQPSFVVSPLVHCWVCLLTSLEHPISVHEKLSPSSLQWHVLQSSLKIEFGSHLSFSLLSMAFARIAETQPKTTTTKNNRFISLYSPKYCSLIKPKSSLEYCSLDGRLKYHGLFGFNLIGGSLLILLRNKKILIY